MSIKKLGGVGVVALGVLGGLGVWLLSTKARPAAAWEPGRYALHYAFALDGAGPAGSTAPISVTLDGQLELREAGEARWLGRVEPGALSVGAGAQGLGLAEAEGGRKALARPFSFALGPRGAVREVSLAVDLPLPVRALLSAVINGSQYVQSDAREGEVPEAVWRASESDMNGSYRATYRLVPDAQPGAQPTAQVEKRWTLGEGDPLGAVRGQAKAEFQLKGPRVVAVHLQEQGDTFGGGPKRPRPPFTLSLSLSRVGPAGEGAWPEAEQGHPRIPFSTAVAMPKDLTIGVGSPRSSKQLLDAVASVPEHETLSAHTALRGELTDAVVRDPNDSIVAEALEKLLRRDDLRQAQARLAVEALLGARTPAANRRAASLIADASLPAMVRSNFLAGATLLGHPGQEIVKAVRGVMSTGLPPYRGQAAMALGGLIAGGGSGIPLPQTDPVEEEILALARRMLDPAPGDPRVTFGVKVRFLRALGNLGTPVCLPLVRKGLADDNLLVRAAAVNALRFQVPATVKEDLARMMRDPALEVRAATLKAARKMGPAATLDLVQTALFFDHSEHVRLHAVYTLGAWSMATPAMRTLLTQAATRERSPKVMQAIRAMLNQNRVEPPFRVDPLDDPEQP